MPLLERLKESLGGPAQDAPDPEQARRIAAAVLLLEMAHADHAHHAVEEDTIRAQLQQYFGLLPEEADELITAARREAHASVSLHPYLQALNAGLAIEDKRRVLEMLWRVAWSDRHLDPYEEHLMRELADLLYLPHRDFIRAKLAVVEGDAAPD